MIDPLSSRILKLAIPARTIPMTVKTLINLFNLTPPLPPNPPPPPLEDFSINSSNFFGRLLTFSSKLSDFFSSISRRGGVEPREAGLIEAMTVCEEVTDEIPPPPSPKV